MRWVTEEVDATRVVERAGIGLEPVREALARDVARPCSDTNWYARLPWPM
jgi:hypothetical protein